MITFDIVVTLIAALITAVVLIFQIHKNTLRKEKRKHAIDALELAKRLACDQENFTILIKNRFESFYSTEEHPVIIKASFIWQAVFGLLVLIFFTIWSIYLTSKGLICWSVISIIFALIGALTAFTVWKEIRIRNQDLEQLFTGIDQYEKSLAAKAKQQPQADVAETRVLSTQESNSKIPEDSTLRRHYETMLDSEHGKLL